jgi:hypothetical protein
MSFRLNRSPPRGLTQESHLTSIRKHRKAGDREKEGTQMSFHPLPRPKPKPTPKPKPKPRRPHR